MPRDTPCGQFDGTWNFFESLNGRVLDISALPHNSTTLGEAELGVDFRIMLIDHKLYAHTSAALFACFKKKNDVTIQRHVQSFEGEGGHQGGNDVVLVIHSTPPIDVAAIASRGKGRECPFCGIYIHYVCMSHDQQRPFPSVALQPPDNIGPVRFKR